MYLQLMRLNDDTQSTIGTLHINGKFQCFTLEDTFNATKVFNETRIPNGTYQITLRKEGGMNKVYSKKKDYHKGMLWLRNVEGFDYIYIHLGNTHIDTSGCILVGNVCGSLSLAHYVHGSSLAYEDLYPKVANAIEKGEEVTIQII